MKKITDIKYGEFEECILDIYHPECESFKTFIYFHGGGLESDDKSRADVLAEYLTSHGILVVSANYRMYKSAKYPEFIEDSAAAVKWTIDHIGEYGTNNGIFVGGSSAGGYLSMMLCFDKKYLGKHGISPLDIDGFVHDAGQPTCHFNILRERGLDTRRVIIDESAALYHIGLDKEYPNMIFIVSDNDMENRYEQTMLLMSTLKHFNYDESRYKLKVMHGSHCEYVSKLDENNESIFGKIIYEYINEVK